MKLNNNVMRLRLGWSVKCNVSMQRSSIAIYVLLLTTATEFDLCGPEAASMHRDSFMNMQRRMMVVRHRKTPDSTGMNMLSATQYRGGLNFFFSLHRSSRSQSVSSTWKMISHFYLSFCPSIISAKWSFSSQIFLKSLIFITKRRKRFAKIKLKKRIFTLLSHKLEVVSKFNSFHAYSLELSNVFIFFSLEKKEIKQRKFKILLHHVHIYFCQILLIKVELISLIIYIYI